jgi:DNA-binding transcriptional LysR family regulator
VRVLLRLGRARYASRPDRSLSGPASRSCCASRESADLIRTVETGDVDVTFIEIGQHETGSLEIRPLLDDPMVFVAPAAAPEAGQRAVSITDIAHLPMIGTRNAGCRQIIDDAFRQSPISPTYIVRSDDNPTIQGLIGSGLAYAVLPLLTVDENDPNVAVIPISPEPRPAISGSHGILRAGRPWPFCPLSRQQPKSVAISTSNGRQRAPREHPPAVNPHCRGQPIRRSGEAPAAPSKA